MQKLSTAFVIAAGLLAFTSCQKSLTAGNTSLGTNGIDSTTPGNSNQLVSMVTLWNTNVVPSTDSTVASFSYDSSGYITLSQLGTLTQADILGAIAYYRDGKERIIKMGSPQTVYTADSFFSYVQYQSAISTQVLFTVFQNTASSPQEHDSTAYTYANGRVTKTLQYATISGATALVNYQTYAYDANGNVTQLNVYLPNGTLNIGYDFMYDDKPNPQHDADDARLPQEWGYILSPNNIVKQVNHYGNPPQMPDDEVTYTYTYNAAGLPTVKLQGGTALGQQTNTIRYYYK